jgi:glycosyltransferase involved in cell wall biosynthesis
MRIALIGKAPPLQGGVASRTYNFAREASRRGHKVDLYTNAEEASSTYRYDLSDADRDYMARDSVGLVVHNIRLGRRITHIPYSACFETRLFGAAVENAKDADLIIGWYFQPYGVVASDLARVLGKRCVLLHAGSDLGRLTKSPELAAAYRHRFSLCNILTTSPITRALLTDTVGFDETRIHYIERGNIIPDYFRARPNKLELHELISSAQPHLEGLEIAPDLRAAFLAHNLTPPTEATTIAIYGKVGLSKGHFELIAALSDLADANLSFNFLFCGGGHRMALEDALSRIAGHSALMQRTRFIPFVPPWRIPSLIRTADAVCFLERDFDVVFHGPTVPREIMLCGRALVLSDEIRAKQPFREALEHGLNYFSAADPRNIPALREQLRNIISMPRSELRNIGERGRTLVRHHYDGRSSDDPILLTLERLGFLNSAFASHTC